MANQLVAFKMAVKTDSERAIEANDKTEIFQVITGLNWIRDWLNNTPHNRYASDISIAEKETFSNLTPSTTSSDADVA